jgi:hypothetical protein
MLLGLAHGELYALVVPPWQSPDEPGHFEHSYLLSRQWRLLSPVETDPRFEQNLIASLYVNDYWKFVPHPQPAQMPLRLADLNTFAALDRTLERPSLSYVPYALALLPIEHQDIDLQLRVLRVLSTLSLPLLVWLAWRSARLLFPDDAGPAIVAAALVALVPQHAYIQASVSDGNLAEVTAALFFLVLMQSAISGLRWQRGLALAALCLAGLLSKNTAMFLVPTAALGVAALMVRRRFSRAEIALTSGALIAVALLGSLFAPRLAQWRNLGGAWRTVFDARSYGAERFPNYWRSLVATFESFWGRFGWMNVRMASGVYVVLGVVCGLLLLGGIARLLLSARPRPRSHLALLLYALATLMSLAFVLGTFVIYYGPYGTYSQGRYLFPAMLPMAVVMAYASGASLNTRIGRLIVAGTVLALVALAGYALLWVVVPFFA